MVPSSHIVWPARRASVAGSRSEISGRFSAPFCCSVAATANRNAATSARADAIGGAYASSQTEMLTGNVASHDDRPHEHDDPEAEQDRVAAPASAASC